jgi:hypothetical protein
MPPLFAFLVNKVDFLLIPDIGLLRTSGFEYIKIDPFTRGRGQGGGEKKIKKKKKKLDNEGDANGYRIITLILSIP